MQAADLSKHLRNHYDRAGGRGMAAYKSGQLTDALAGYSEAFALADAAVSIVPSRDYARWAERRAEAFKAQKHVRVLIAAERSAQGAAAAK